MKPRIINDATLFIEPVSFCNLKCNLCYVNIDRERTIIPKEIIVQFVNDYHELVQKALRIIWCGAGEIFMHVAAANYGIPTFLGVKAPAGFDFGTYEHTLTKKSDIAKALKDSFAHMEGAFEAMSDADLDKPAEFFGMKTTARGAYLLLLSHAHEHLGQAIAYARSINVTPPWTAKQQAEEAKAKKK